MFLEDKKGSKGVAMDYAKLIEEAFAELNEVDDFCEEYAETFGEELLDIFRNDLHVNDAHYNYGASKFVIWFDSDKNYVYKIPFKVKYNEYYGDYPNEVEFVELEYDYCKKEADMYEEITDQDEEIAKLFFLKTEVVREMRDGYLLYRQTACCSCGIEYSGRKSLYKESLEKATGYNQHLENLFPTEFFDYIFKVYTTKAENLIARLVKLVDSLDINDIHRNNVGFTDIGTPVIFDYSGYYG
jgi:hypothetical protein